MYLLSLKKYKFENDLFLFENAPEILKENISNRYIFDNNTLIDNPFVLTSGMCTIGKHKLFVDVHGNFYPCEKVGETNKDFLIGNCIEGFDLKKCTDLINFTSLFSDRCLNCIAMRDCQMCIKDFAVSGVYNEKSEEICEHYQNTFMEQLRAKAILHEALFEGGENSEIQ